MNRFGEPSRVSRIMLWSKYSIQPRTTSPPVSLIATGVCFSLNILRYEASCPVSFGGGAFVFFTVRGLRKGMGSFYILFQTLEKLGQHSVSQRNPNNWEP